MDQLHIQKASIQAQVKIVATLMKAEIAKLDEQAKPIGGASPNEIAMRDCSELNHIWHLYTYKHQLHTANHVLSEILTPAVNKCKLSEEQVMLSVVKDGAKEWWAIRLEFKFGKHTYLKKLLKEALIGLNEKGDYSTTKPQVDCQLFTLPAEPVFTGTWGRLQDHLRGPSAKGHLQPQE